MYFRTKTILSINIKWKCSNFKGMQQNRKKPINCIALSNKNDTSGKNNDNPSAILNLWYHTFFRVNELNFFGIYYLIVIFRIISSHLFVPMSISILKQHLAKNIKVMQILRFIVLYCLFVCSMISTQPLKFQRWNLKWRSHFVEIQKGLSTSVCIWVSI